MNVYNKLIKKYQENVNIWINKINYSSVVTKDDLIWVKKYHAKIGEYIEKNYLNLNTKKTHYVTLAKIFQLMDNAMLYSKYKKKYMDIIEILKGEIPKQKISGNKILNWVPNEIIVAKRDELEKEHIKDPKNVLIHFQYLVLCLYTLEPPKRQEYKNMMIITNNSQDDKLNNFILHTNTKSYIIINKDKVTKYYGSIKLELTNILHKVITKSLKIYPRKYILSLTSNPNTPIKKQGLENLLKSIFDDVNLSVNILRGSYITEFYSHTNDSLDQKINLAKRMRHSQKTAEEFYKKVTDYTKILKERKILKDNDDDDDGFDLKKWSKEYQNKNPEKFKEASKKYYDANKEKVLRRKILYNLNSGNVVKPTNATIEKYKLKYDKVKKMWY